MQPHIHEFRAMSACAPTADVSLQRGEPLLRAKRRHRRVSFDHLVGEGEQVWWQFETDGFRRL